MKPRRIKVILPTYELCTCKKEIYPLQNETASEYEVRYTNWKEHTHGKCLHLTKTTDTSTGIKKCADCGKVFKRRGVIERIEL